MKSFKTLVNRRARQIVTAALLLVATVAPALTSIVVAADQVTTRSIELSSASTSAQNVTYTVKFTAIQAAGAFVIDFCGNSPLIGSTCTPPTDFSASSAASASTGVTAVTAPSASEIIVTDPLTANENVDVDITGITNPSATGPLYARIVTYDTATHAADYTSTDLDPNTTGGVRDQGSVAMYINPSVNVSAAVLETMTFCVSGAGGTTESPTDPITADCGGTLLPPKVQLGHDVGGVIALDSAAVYSGNIYTQISTNAVGGAIVSLKNSATCGGLHRAGAAANVCDIAAAGITGTDDVTQGQAKFGLKLGADVTDPTNGDFVASTGYNSTQYHLNYVDGTTGVTGPYGDPILNTNGNPANNRDMPITFGASAANNTPAGLYSADLSLIATGTF